MQWVQLKTNIVFPDKKDESEDKDASGPTVSATGKKKYDYVTKINYLFREARFFLMKSNNEENISLSKSKAVWSTPPQNESKLNQAIKECRNVILIYSVKESGKFCGEFWKILSMVQVLSSPGKNVIGNSVGILLEIIVFYYFYSCFIHGGEALILYHHVYAVVTHSTIIIRLNLCLYHHVVSKMG